MFGAGGEMYKYSFTVSGIAVATISVLARSEAAALDQALTYAGHRGQDSRLVPNKEHFEFFRAQVFRLVLDGEPKSAFPDGHDLATHDLIQPSLMELKLGVEWLGITPRLSGRSEAQP